MNAFQKDLSESGVVPPTAKTTTTPAAHPATHPSTSTSREYTAAEAAVDQALAAKSAWQTALDSATGAYYYYNTVSGVTSWMLPDDERLWTDVQAEQQAKEEAEHAAKKQKLEQEEQEAEAAAATERVIEIDENTGLGKWESVEPTTTTKSSSAIHDPAPFSDARRRPPQTISQRIAEQLQQKRLDAHRARMEAMGDVEHDDGCEDDIIKQEATLTKTETKAPIRIQFGSSSIVRATPKVTNVFNIRSEPLKKEPSRSPPPLETNVGTTIPFSTESSSSLPINFKKRKDRGGQKTTVQQ